MSIGSPSPDRRSPGHGWFAVAGVAVLAFAAVLRLDRLDAALFWDELWVVELMRAGPYVPHFNPMPPLFFWMVKAASALLGFSDVALHVTPFVIGVALVAAPLALRGLLPGSLERTEAFIWTWLLAFSSPVIYYSARLKQYSLEALASLLLIGLCLWCVSEIHSKKRMIVFFASASVAMLLLHTPVFLFPGCVAALLLAVWLAGRMATHFPWALAGRVAAGSVITSLCFVAAYFGYLKPSPEMRYPDPMYEFWAHLFFDGRWSFVEEWSRIWVGQMLNLVKFFWLAAAIAIAIWIARAVIRRDVVELAKVVVGSLPVLSLLAASWLRLYPYGEVRLMLFLAPGLYLLVAASSMELMRALPRLAFTGLTILLVTFLVQQVVRDPHAQYFGATDLRPLYDFVGGSHRSREPILSAPADAKVLGWYYPRLALLISVGSPEDATPERLGDAEGFWTVARPDAGRPQTDQYTLESQLDVGSVRASHYRRRK
ncbi:MAG TPA: hypothetical protein VMT00_13655 [Thermoanaerobaculia bacterium]|nr:hypothetical protein [Thermoanaerobaculia bacterium]